MMNAHICIAKRATSRLRRARAAGRRPPSGPAAQAAIVTGAGNPQPLADQRHGERGRRRRRPRRPGRPAEAPGMAGSASSSGSASIGRRPTARARRPQQPPLAVIRMAALWRPHSPGTDQIDTLMLDRLRRRGDRRRRDQRRACSTPLRRYRSERGAEPRQVAAGAASSSGSAPCSRSSPRSLFVLSIVFTDKARETPATGADGLASAQRRRRWRSKRPASSGCGATTTRTAPSPITSWSSRSTPRSSST